MSKKCCGIIYNDNEKFCTMCGKSLADLPDIETEEGNRSEDSKSLEIDMAEVEKIAASVREEVTKDSKEESQPSNHANQEAEEDKTENAEADADQAAPQEEGTENKSEVPATEETNRDADKESVDEEEEEDDDDEDDGTASPVLRFFGTLMILLMLASVAAVGLGVYFIMLKPFYKNHDINNPVVYEEMATDTDVTNIESRPALTMVSIDPATATDASEEATATDATETDASDEEESEDME